jgi:hypothetical protein
MDSNGSIPIDISLELFTAEEKKAVKNMYKAHNDYSKNNISKEEHKEAIENGHRAFQSMLRRINAELDTENSIKGICGPEIYEQAINLIKEPIILEQLKIVTNVIKSIQEYQKKK